MTARRRACSSCTIFPSRSGRQRPHLLRLRSGASAAPGGTSQPGDPAPSTTRQRVARRRNLNGVRIHRVSARLVQKRPGAASRHNALTGGLVRPRAGARSVDAVVLDPILVRGVAGYPLRARPLRRSFIGAWTCFRTPARPNGRARRACCRRPRAPDERRLPMLRRSRRSGPCCGAARNATAARPRAGR
jgi:hypothetical protein